jgi:hypothetical protein
VAFWRARFDVKADEAVAVSAAGAIRSDVGS